MLFIEPYKIKAVESIKLLPKEEREKKLQEAYFNLFKIKAEDVFIDLLTDSGTNAMSDYQWSGIMLGDEAYAGCKNFYNLEKTVQEIFGYKYVIPVHQGRAAENLFFSTVLKEGDYVPSNTHFDTTRANVKQKGGIPVDCFVEEAADSNCAFKGNMDLNKLENLIKEKGKEKIPLGMMTITNNSRGGQPVSMENIRETKKLLDKYNIPLYFDAARFAENAYFIKIKEKNYEKKTILEICQEMFSYGEGCLMSAKKDGLANMGGFFATNNEKLMEKVTQLSILIEGFPTYGGLAGRDLEAVARGLREVLDENYLAFRISQVKYLGDRLSESGIPIIKPTGGHAVFVDAGEFLEHTPKENFPGQALAVALYREGGIRAVEIGRLMFPQDAKEKPQKIYDMVRLAIPRRVYTNSHLDYVADIFKQIASGKEKVRGLKIIYQAPFLRHFTARLEEV